MKYKNCCGKNQEKQGWAQPVIPAPPELQRAMDFERAKTLEARLEVFQRALDEGSLDGENAFLMISELYRPVQKQQPGRIRELIDAVRVQAQPAYEPNAAVFVAWQIEASLGGPEEGLPALLDEMAELAADDPDAFDALMDRLGCVRQ
jgi:hypothetical protein